MKEALAKAAEDRERDHAKRTAAWAAAVAAGRGAGYCEWVSERRSEVLFT